MSRKILTAFLASVLVVILLVSCAKTATETTPNTAAGKTTATAPSQTPTAPPTSAPPATSTPAKTSAPITTETSMYTELPFAQQQPKYGGWLKQAYTKATPGWDQAFIAPTSLDNINLAAEDLLSGDWTKGPAGTNETNFVITGPMPPNITIGCLAESWEWNDPTTFTFHIRKGVQFQNKPPVNGREMTADDVVFSLNRLYTIKTSWLLTSAPNKQIPTSITAPNKYTVVIKCPDSMTAPTIFEMIGLGAKIIPREVVDKYGDMNAWQNVVGTGPFIVQDEVAGSSTTFARNPNYWMRDPFHLENQLPYPDGVRWLVIPDQSTRVAAMRTAKVDVYKFFSWEDGQSLLKTNPELQVKIRPSSTPYCLFPNLSKKPYDDIKVRKALSMAIDRQGIVDDYYKGNARLYDTPVLDIPDLRDIFIPLKDLPKSVQENWEYNPTRAKQLLAEAGYPAGFKTEIICYTGYDIAPTLVKAYWDKIGVQTTVTIRDYASFSTIGFGRQYDNFIFWYQSSGNPFYLSSYKADVSTNFSGINDKRTEDTYNTIMNNWGDFAKKAQAYRDWEQYALDQCWIIQPPNVVYWYMWQPWLKGYYGTSSIGYSYYENLKYTWIDQEIQNKVLGKK